MRREVEYAVVQQDVAIDRPDALFPDGLHQILHPFAYQLRVSAALDHQVAVQHAVLDIALREDARFPEMAGTQQVETGVGGDQLHHGGRVHLRIGLPRQTWRGGSSWCWHRVTLAGGEDTGWLMGHGSGRWRQRGHDHRHAAGRYACAVQCIGDPPGKCVLGVGMEGQGCQPDP